jgi:hypothetical protein
MSDFYICSQVTATDRAGVVWVAAILSLLFSALTLATRFQIKYHTTLENDDWAILTATLMAIGQYTAVFVGLEHGVGVSSATLPPNKLKNLGEVVRTTEVFFIIAIAPSKLSVVLFMKRLFTRDLQKAWWACNIALILTVSWGLASALTVSVKCNTWHALYSVHRCSGKVRSLTSRACGCELTATQLIRWAVVIPTDAALDTFYVALVIVLVQPLQMTTAIKLTVILAFRFRLVCALLSAIHWAAFASYVHSSDPGLAIADVQLWQQVALGYALIGATLPTLKSFIRVYNRVMGWPSGEKRILGGGYNLGSFGRSGVDSTRSRTLSRLSGSWTYGVCADEIELRPKETGYHAGAYHDSRARRIVSSGSSESESKNPIIRCDISVVVEHELTGRPSTTA